MHGFGRGLIGLGCLVVLFGSVRHHDAQQGAPAASLGVPLPGPDGWGAGDERGNGNTQSFGTRLAARHSSRISLARRIRDRPRAEPLDAAESIRRWARERGVLADTRPAVHQTRGQR